MQNLRGLETGVLLDLLVKQTAELTAKMSEKNSIAIQQYEYEIALIQAELNSRKQKGNTNIEDLGINYSASPNSMTG
ncbi:MAG TPA: hypothetical protein VHL77_13325 [Ferruginibacter sp.]|jgi:hypothetical protein|nr:hypothetical protein [Ferruginibacter sp.]